MQIESNSRIINLLPRFVFFIIDKFGLVFIIYLDVVDYILLHWYKNLSVIRLLVSYAKIAYFSQIFTQKFEQVPVPGTKRVPQGSFLCI